MKKILALAILLSYVNFFMLPKAEAAGPFDVYGQIQQDALNNFTEFISTTVLGNDSQKPVKDDNEESQSLGAEEIPDYFFHQYSLRVDHGKFLVTAKEYSTHTSSRLVAACFETFSPPPEA